MPNDRQMQEMADQNSGTDWTVAAMLHPKERPVKRLPLIALAPLAASSCQNPSWNRQYIVLAAKDLKAGHRIEETDVGMIMTAKLFAKHFPEDALHDESRAVGHTLKQDVAKDSPILQSELQ